MAHDNITLTGPGGFNCQVSNASGFWLPANTPIVTSARLWVGTDQNLCLQSQTMVTGTAPTSPWVDFPGGTLVMDDDAAVAPDGTATADYIEFPAAADAAHPKMFYQGFTGTAASWTASVWLKTVSGSGTVYIELGNAADTATSVACAVTTTWQRFSVTRTLTAATWYFIIGLDTQAWTGQPSAQDAINVDLWGAQVQPGTIASPYRATVAAALASTATYATTPTRCSNVGKFAIGITVTPDMTWTEAGYHTLWSFGINDVANSCTLYQYGNVLNMYSYNGSTQAITTNWSHGLTGTTEAKIAIEITGTTLRYSINGGAITSKTLTGTGTGISTLPAALKIGNCGTASLQLGGHVKKIVQANSIQEVLQELSKA